MKIPIFACPRLRLLSMFTILSLVFAPLTAMASDTTMPRSTASASPVEVGSLVPASGIINGEVQLVASQSVTTTETVTPTRGGGLFLPKLTIPKQDDEPVDDENASDETADDEPSVEDASEAVEESEETADEMSSDASSDAVSELADVRGAVIQIEAVGTFVDPAEGMQLNAAGRGSGFIIDPSGIAVTNNHVVTGGGLYKIYLDGEDEPRNAKVLGVSECADLAVIDIQGDGFPYLEWYDGRIQVGLDVYAVGFPLGDPEFTMTRGIVAKERADGDTNWASVDRVIQHDASINPGNSGGPLVNEDGQVVAVNYAGNSQTNQYFAISRDQAVEVIEQLRTGVNVDSIGINGEAINNGEGLSGHWVASVKSGSPADRAGIKGGDIILKMEGLVLADDGSMATYCDILQSHAADDVLSVQVLRFATEEVLEGQINGRELTSSFSIADILNGEEEGTSTEAGSESEEGAAVGYAEYSTITDRTGILSMEVPTEWSDVTSDDWKWDDETVGIRLVAAGDIEEMLANWGYPGVIFNFSTSLVETYTPEDILDNWQYTSSCTYKGRSALPDGFFTGAYDHWTECKGDDNGAIIISLVPDQNNYILLLEIYLAGNTDYDAVDHILDSFVIDTSSLTSASNRPATDATGSETIFDLVDTTGLIYNYVLVSEPALTAILPTDWADLRSDSWVDDDDSELGYLLSASSDVDGYNDNWVTSGIYVRSATGLTDELDIADLLDSVDLSNICTYDDRYTHTHTIYGITYDGAYDLYTDCDGEANAFAYLVVQSDDLDQAVLLEFLAVSDADVEAFGVLLQSFYIDDVAPAETTEQEAAADDYTVVSDDSETLVVRIPVDWTDIDSGDWELDGRVVGIRLEAAPDLESYNNGWTTPGIFYGASPEFTGSEPQEILDILDFSSDCTLSDRFEYDDNVFAGHYDLWEACGGTETSIVFLAATPQENSAYLVLIGVQLPTTDDFATLDEIFKSFNLNLPSDGTSDVTPTAQVVVDALNVRSGPGTNYGRVGGVNRGEQLIVIGEYNNCAWLNVQTRSELVGWVSGNAQYVNFNGNCAEIPAVDPPAPPQNSGGSRSGNSGGGGAVSGKGCYLFQNGLGPEITITYTRRNDGWNITFKVPPDGETRQCFDPGEYTYTLDAPPPWGSTNGEMTVSAGDNYLFPISPGE